MKKLSMKLMLLLLLIITGVIYSPIQESLAAGTAVEVCAVSYSDESILVFTNGNSKIYYGTEAEAAKNNWDVIEIDPTTEKIAVIDISWLTPTYENTIFIKGNTNDKQSRVTINKRPTKLEVSINYSQIETLNANDNIGPILNVMSSEGTAANPINFSDLEWKKGDDGRWIPSTYLTKRVLENYMLRGTNIYFRIAPIDDIVNASTTSGNPADIRTRIMNFSFLRDEFTDIVFGNNYPTGIKGRRVSGAVKLKIAKKVTLPVTGVDGSKFTVDIKYGQEYRVKDKDGNIIINWTKVTDSSTKKLPLSTLVNGTKDGLYDTSRFPEMVIEIRTSATSKAAASKITEKHLDEQWILPGTIKAEAAPSGADATDKNIYITYNGIKNINIQIPSASQSNPYEYCVFKKGIDFDLQKASWTPITKGSIVKVLASKAPDDSKIYIRQKEIKYKAKTSNKEEVAFKLASTMGVYEIKYAFLPTAPKTTYVYTKGYPEDIHIDVTLNDFGKMPYETSVKYIKLGTNNIAFEKPTITPSIESGIDTTMVYTMRITLKSSALETMTNCTAKALTIYYDNGTIDKTSSKLTIKNPTPALSLTTEKGPGSTSGTVAVRVTSIIETGNRLVYKVDTTKVTKMNKEDKISDGTPFTSGMDLAIPAAGQYLNIYELDASNHVIKFIQIEAEKLQP